MHVCDYFIDIFIYLFLSPLKIPPTSNQDIGGLRRGTIYSLEETENATF